MVNLMMRCNSIGTVQISYLQRTERDNQNGEQKRKAAEKNDTIEREEMSYSQLGREVDR